MPLLYQIIIERDVSPLEEIHLRAEVDSLVKRWSYSLKTGIALNIDDISAEERCRLLDDGVKDLTPKPSCATVEPA